MPTPRPLKIALLGPIAWRTPPRRYGPWEQVVASLAAGLVERGHEVTLFATGDSRTPARLSWVCPRPLNEDPSLNPGLYDALHVAACFRRAGEFDLIHNHMNWPPLAFAGLIPAPVLTTLHGAALLEPGSREAFGRFAGLPYVAISEAERRGVPELNYVATIHNGIDLTRFTFRPEAGAYLLYLGRIAATKGTHLAVELARRTGERLVIAAHLPPDEEGYFRARVLPHLDSDLIDYVGEVGPDRRNELLGGARALVHLVTAPEPFGLVLAEAQACGTPVIAHGLGSVPEVVKHGETGFVVDSGRGGAEGVMRAAAKAVDRLGQIDRAACRRWVEENFTVDRMANGYVQAYRKVLEEPRGPVEVTPGATANSRGR